MKFSRPFIVMLIALSALTACRQGQETPPVPRDKMGKILLDMQLAEAYSQGLGDSTKNKFEKNNDSLAGFYTSILKHYNLSFPQFNEALEWYKERPMLLDSLYSKVLTQLIEIKARRGITDSENPDVKDVKQDSLKVNVPDTAKARTDVMQAKSVAPDTTLKQGEKRGLKNKKKTTKSVFKPKHEE